jgi:integrase
MPGNTKRIDVSKRSVDALPSRDKEYFAWDKTIKGFGVRIESPRAKHPKGRRTFIFTYRNSYGKTRKPKIGDVGVITPAQAREIARDWAHKVSLGIDPQGDREKKRRAMNIREFEKLYFEQYANDRKRPRSIKSDRTLFRLHIQPRLGSLAMEEVTSTHIQDLHHAMKASPGAANRTIALLSKAFNLAEKWKFRPEHSNPCIHIEKYPEHKVEQYLSEPEFTRLGEVLAEMDRTQETLPSITAAIRMLIFTGARLSEILNLTWDQVDNDNSCLRLEATYTKEKKAKSIHLPPAAQEILQGIEQQDGSPWVFQGRKTGQQLVNLRKPWHRIRQKAGLPKGTRLHDLRHSFASIGLKRGMSLPMIGKLLGHTQPTTTARYAHLAHDPAQEAAAQIGNQLSAALNGNQSAEIIELNKT